jgi:UDP-glucose 4-epimerase
LTGHETLPGYRGAGFLGSHLTEALVGRAWRVRVLDDFSTGTRANLAPVAGHVEVVEADVRDLGPVRQAAAGVELIFHLAAPRYDSWETGYPSTLALGTLNVLVAAREAQTRRVVFASSLCVYGLAEPGRRAEGDPKRPASAYAAAKLTGELDCTTFAHLYGLEAVCLRYANVFGPRPPAAAPYAEAVPRVVRALLAGRPPLLRDDGLQPQDILFVADGVRATLLAAEAAPACGRVYNIGSGGATTPREVADACNELLGTRLEPLPAAPRAAAETDTLLDGARAWEELGFAPQVDLLEGLARCLPPGGGAARAARSYSWGA